MGRRYWRHSSHPPTCFFEKYAYLHFAIFTQDVLEDTIIHINDELGIYLDETTPIFRVQFFKERADTRAEKRRQSQQMQQSSGRR